MSDPSSFSAVVTKEVVEPIQELCEYFSEGEAHNEYAFFTNILFMLREPDNEVAVLAAVIELSKCRFVGLNFSMKAEHMINDVLDRAIMLSHTMSAPIDQLDSTQVK